MTKRALLLNEQWEPIKAATVEMYDSDTGDLLATAETDFRGVATFTTPAAGVVPWFRPRMTRGSGMDGKLPLTGVINFWQIADGADV